MVTKSKILVVEDDEALCDALCLALRDEGYEVSSAHDGKEGLALAEEHHPNLILLDVMMAEKDGLEVLDELRSTKHGKDIGIVILTNYNDPEKIQEAIKNRADFFLVKKDWRMEDIVKQVNELVNKK